ncbi:uncharacterized protein BDV14DRAFT_198256 [Aspergillus stella-maris]|uniref:uncharacterized protein n=1 Tax=Aspergillus stella-maris TaxID=1810926 RepID=UPI003CCE1766
MSDERPGPDAWKDFVSKEPLLIELQALKQKGWSNPAGDTFFADRRQQAARPSYKQKRLLYDMTKSIGENLVRATDILDTKNQTSDDTFRALDLCMAPGGFSATVKNNIPNAHIDGITLPPKLGGYEVLADRAFREIKHADITMYVSEMDVDANTYIPPSHPDREIFIHDRPFLVQQYNLIFCGGGVVRVHDREDYRKGCEGARLTLSQLVFALNRLKSGGSFVLLMHRVEARESASLMYMISRFAEIQAFKSPKAHGMTSSFYLVAKHVDTQSDAAVQALDYWKAQWSYLTFREFAAIDEPVSGLKLSAEQLVAEFGTEFLGIARPIWKIQRDNLQRAPFTQSG